MNAAPDAKPRRIDIGFTGGQVLALRVSDEAYAGLRGALEGEAERGWHQVLTEDSEVTVDLREVVYVRLDTERHRVGF